MATPPPTLSLRYLGGFPDRHKPEHVAVTVFEDRFEVRGGGWGWRVAYAAIGEIGTLRPAGDDGEGEELEIAWSLHARPRTLRLAGRDATRLRFLLATALGEARRTAATEGVPPARRVTADARPGRPRPPGPWQRELRRMRLVTATLLTAALCALVLVVGVAVVVLGRAGGDGHWRQDRALVEEQVAEAQRARERNDLDALARALGRLAAECERLQGYNGDAANTGRDFAAVQRACAEIGIVLF